MIVQDLSVSAAQPILAEATRHASLSDFAKSIVDGLIDIGAHEGVLLMVRGSSTPMPQAFEQALAGEVNLPQVVTALQAPGCLDGLLEQTASKRRRLSTLPPQLQQALVPHGHDFIDVSTESLASGGYVLLLAFGSSATTSTEASHDFGGLAHLCREFANEIDLQLHSTGTDLREERLQRALTAAHAASNAKSRFLALMSHEIRTPMTAIVGFAHMLERETGTPTERREWLQQIRRNSDYLLHLVNDVLDISKIEAGELEVEMSVVDPSREVMDACAMFGPMARERGLELRTDIAVDDSIRVTTDRLRLRQIVVNLVSNALKYTREGTVEVSLNLCDGPMGEPEMIITVTDTGIGISEQDLPHLFKNFRQVHRNPGKFAGTGLGLSLVKRLVGLLGGNIDVESVLGVGTSFQVAVPVNIADETDRTELGEAVGDHGFGANCLAGARILVVDDNPINLSLIRSLLEADGADVSTLSDGVEAVEAHSRGEIDHDLVIMDLQMSLMDGDEATRRLRAEGYEGLIVILTAISSTSDQARCLEAGCNGFLTKPVDPDRFGLRLAGLLAENGIKPDPSTASDQQASTSDGTQSAASAAGVDLSDIAAQFQASLGEWMQKSQILFEDEDMAGLRAHCHRLRGPAVPLGFRDLAQTLRACEDAIEDGHSFTQIQERLSKVHHLINLLEPAGK